MALRTDCTCTGFDPQAPPQHDRKCPVYIENDIATLQAEVKRVDDVILKMRQELVPTVMKLNAYKQKCPTCRCKILPGEKCRCCAEPTCLDDLP